MKYIGPNNRDTRSDISEILRNALERLPDGTVVISKQNPGSFITVGEVGAPENNAAYVHVDDVGKYLLTLVTLGASYDPRDEIKIQDSFVTPAMHTDRIASGLLKAAASSDLFYADVFYRHEASLN